MSEETSDLEGIPARLQTVRERIDTALLKAGRPLGSARLIAVSKGKSASAIRAAHAAGQREFGENYAQELEEKAQELRDLDGLVWHAIGQLQRNKAKNIVAVAPFIHAVDREELALEIDRRAAALGKHVDVLIEVNVAGEASKGGCTPGAFSSLLNIIQQAHNVTAVGLMTIPPATDAEEDARPFFAALKALRDTQAPDLPHLSMGMSHDYGIAIEEGATLVRVGTAIFGARTTPVT